MSAWVYDDGGRSEAGYKADTTGDCAVRAVAIATEQDYRETYNALRRKQKAMGYTWDIRKGVWKETMHAYMADLGWTWTPKMRPGQRERTHVKASELPAGRLVLSLSRHYLAFVDGVAHDTYDPTRDGSRTVYGYWSK